MQKIERPTREEQPKLLPGRTPKPKNTGHHKKNNGSITEILTVINWRSVLILSKGFKPNQQEKQKCGVRIYKILFIIETLNLPTQISPIKQVIESHKVHAPLKGVARRDNHFNFGERPHATSRSTYPLRTEIRCRQLQSLQSSAMDVKQGGLANFQMTRTRWSKLDAHSISGQKRALQITARLRKF